jgi:hypothetical protein
MSYLNIQGTPLQINLRYAEDSGAVLLDHALIGNGSLTTLGNLLGGLISSQIVAALQTLVTPIDQLFGTFWSDPNTQSEVQSAVQAAVVSAKSNAYNIVVSVPQSGTLRAQTGNVSPGLLGALPPGVPAIQLTLSFQVPGFTANFSTTTGGIWGKWADPEYQLTFDGEIVISIAIAQDPRIPPVLAGTFWAHNLQGSASNFFAGWTGFWDTVWDFLTSQPGPNQPMGDQSQNVSGPLAPLLQGLLQIGPPLQQAFGYGFQLLGPVVTPTALPGATPGNTIELDLTHPVAVGPVISNALTGSGPSLFQAQIGVTPLQLHAGDQLGVMGSFFPAAQSTQLVVSWTDTTLGTVIKSELSWGPTAAQNVPPTNPTVVEITRHGEYDGANTYAAKNLNPSSWYAFQVRDFDVPGFDLIASERSTWKYLQTAASDQVQLVLDYQNTVVGFGTMQSDGTFAATVIVPASIPAGTYVLWALLGGQQMAQASFTVVAPNTALQPTLQILSDTGIPFTGAAIAVDTENLPLRGTNYSPGPVNLFVDSPSGASLGTATADSSGGFTTSVTWPFGVNGPHAVVGQQGAAEASAQVFAENAAS